MCEDKSTILLSYNCESGKYSILSGDERLFGGDRLAQAALRYEQDVAVLLSQVQEMAKAQTPQAKFSQLRICGKFYRVGMVMPLPGKNIAITLTDLADESSSNREKLDDLTGLMNRETFCLAVEQQLRLDQEAADRGEYAVIYIDFQRFKVVNELFGRAKGDELLITIGNVLRSSVQAPGFSSRITSDHFAVFLRLEEGAVEQVLQAVQAGVEQFDMPFEVSFHAGVYQVTAKRLSANTMLDRAAMALSSIKGSYNVRCAYYTPDMRRALLGEQEIMGMMSTALAQKQFLIHYQPQYNHSTGMLVGAEALVRWLHPTNGLIPPNVFIPIFEKSGFITNLDLYVFQEVCIFLRKSMDNHWSIVPISVNFSRYDVFQPELVQQMEQIRQAYDVPAKYLRVELTESALVGGSDYVNEVIGKLHQCGYVVEMDDFGSGYSSLNVLKDIDLDIIKLDMRFLSQEGHSNKGGTILSSIVRMARWLDLPVIAEGVETVEQADFLRSIGCEYIQGYLYSRPLPEEKYAELVSASRIGATVPQMQLIDTLNAYDFWDPKSQETLIFSNYVGAAAIIDFHRGKLELLRVNKKYLQEFGMNLTEKELIQSDPLDTMSIGDQNIYLDMLKKAIETGEEQESETWRNIQSSCCGEERFCIRTTVRVIGISNDRYLFHAMVRNITAERLYYESVQDNDRRLRAMADQVNIYYWEYNIATKEMRPCFRCQRDLGLPPLLTNYPEPAIESGIWPPEVADDYRDFMRQIDEGAPSMERIYPLTDARVPFHVRYTTEFDENGHAVKSYGSAALVIA